MESFILKFPSHTQLTDDELFDFCSTNKGLRIERNTKGELIIMSPVGGKSSSHNNAVGALLWLWNQNNKTGITFDSSGGFVLPDKAMRSPDAAWVDKKKWELLSEDQKKRFPPLSPDFVIKILSESDSLKELKLKMEEWIQNGTRLAWLIDPIEQKAYVYSEKGLTKTVDSFSEKLDGGDVLPGFELSLEILK